MGSKLNANLHWKKIPQLILCTLKSKNSTLEFYFRGCNNYLTWEHFKNRQDVESKGQREVHLGEEEHTLLHGGLEEEKQD